MRHVRSIIYALVLAPTAWVLCGMGFTGDLVARAGGTSDTLEALTGLMLLLSAGSAYAILLLAPISPAGPLLGGLAFFGVGLWALGVLALLLASVFSFDPRYMWSMSFLHRKASKATSVNRTRTATSIEKAAKAKGS